MHLAPQPHNRYGTFYPGSALTRPYLFCRFWRTMLICSHLQKENNNRYLLLRRKWIAIAFLADSHKKGRVRQDTASETSDDNSLHTGACQHCGFSRQFSEFGQQIYQLLNFIYLSVLRTELLTINRSPVSILVLGDSQECLVTA